MHRNGSSYLIYSPVLSDGKNPQQVLHSGPSQMVAEQQ